MDFAGADMGSERRQSLRRPCEQDFRNGDSGAPPPSNILPEGGITSGQTRKS